MKIEHIVWEHPPYEGMVTGLLQVKLVYHGGGHSIRMFAGTFDVDTQEAKLAGTIPLDFGPGVAGAFLERVGTLEGEGYEDQ